MKLKNKSKYLVVTKELIVPIGVILFSLFLYIFTTRGSYFRVKHIICELDYEPCPDSSILVEVTKYEGENLFLANLAELKKTLLSGDFTVREVSVTQVFPDMLRVNLISVYPTLAVRVDGTERWVTLDERYYVIGVRDISPNVPELVVTSIPGVQIGKKLDDNNIVEAGEAMKNLAKAGVSFTSAVLSSQWTLELELDSGLRIIMDTEGDMARQIELLTVILSDHEVIKNSRVVDVRYREPILR